MLPWSHPRVRQLRATIPRCIEREQRRARSNLPLIDKPTPMMNIVYCRALVKRPPAVSERANICAQPMPSNALTMKAMAGICRLKSMDECTIATADTAKAAAGR